VSREGAANIVTSDLLQLTVLADRGEVNRAKKYYCGS